MTSKGCRHRRAWPTSFVGGGAMWWCPDCGAVRPAVERGHGYEFEEPRWRTPYPGKPMPKWMERMLWRDA